MNSRERQELDRHITGNWGEDQMQNENQFADLLSALEAAFIAMGRQGANANVNHPLRKDWEAARSALMKAGSDLCLPGASS